MLDANVYIALAIALVTRVRRDTNNEQEILRDFVQTCIF